jgi:hypothetical protein
MLSSNFAIKPINKIFIVAAIKNQVLLHMPDGQAFKMPLKIQQF